MAIVAGLPILHIYAIFLINFAPCIGILLQLYSHYKLSFSVEQKLGMDVSIMHAKFQGNNFKNQKMSEKSKIACDFQRS